MHYPLCTWNWSAKSATDGDVWSREMKGWTKKWTSECMTRGNLRSIKKEREKHLKLDCSPFPPPSLNPTLTHRILPVCSREFACTKNIVLKNIGGGGALLWTLTFLSANPFSTMAKITTTIILYLLWKYQRHRRTQHCRLGFITSSRDTHSSVYDIVLQFIVANCDNKFVLHVAIQSRLQWVTAEKESSKVYGKVKYLPLFASLYWLCMYFCLVLRSKCVGTAKTTCLFIWKQCMTSSKTKNYLKTLLELNTCILLLLYFCYHTIIMH